MAAIIQSKSVEKADLIAGAGIFALSCEKLINAENNVKQKTGMNLNTVFITYDLCFKKNTAWVLAKNSYLSLQKGTIFLHMSKFSIFIFYVRS